jgi:pimeloyl-ACP methyl ester carboxylesterase
MLKEYIIDTPNGNIFAKKWIPKEICSDTPFVLLHDSLGSISLWRDFPDILANKLSRSVIAYDRLGFGKSDARDALPSFEFIEEEATVFFPCVKESLSLSKYILFGHSVGGAMSISIASRDEDCAAVITEASQAFVEDLTIEGIKDGKQAFQEHGQIERLEKWHGKKAEWVLRAWTDVWLSPEFSNWSLEACIGSVNCPVLVIHGDKDEYGSIAFPEFIAGKVGGISEMLILQNCGHVPHREKTKDLIERVELFLNKHGI